MPTVTQTQFQDMIDRNLNPFRQDVVGDNTIVVSAATEVLFLADGDARNVSQAPSYFTDRYDTATGIMKATTEYDAPTYVGEPNFTWTPSASSEGIALIRLYINDTVPKLIKTYPIHYKGDSAFPLSVLTEWYWGTSAGYDAKNDGVYWTVEFEHAGTISNPAMVIRHGQ